MEVAFSGEIESMGQVTSSYAQSPLGKPVNSALQESPLFKDHTQEKAQYSLTGFEKAMCLSKNSADRRLTCGSLG